MDANCLFHYRKDKKLQMVCIQKQVRCNSFLSKKRVNEIFYFPPLLNKMDHPY